MSKDFFMCVFCGVQCTSCGAELKKIGLRNIRESLGTCVW